MSIVFLDFETSGLNPYRDDIIEIAVKQMNTNISFSTLVKPKSDECISEHITALTNITNKLLRDKGDDWKEAYIKLNEFLKEIIKSSLNNKLYIVAHNGETFDFIFLKRIFSELNNINIKTIPLKNIVLIDSLLFAKRLLKRDYYKQVSLCKSYNINTNGSHRALNDIRALEELFIVFGNLLDKNLNKRRKVLENPQMIYDYIHFKI